MLVCFKSNQLIVHLIVKYYTLYKYDDAKYGALM